MTNTTFSKKLAKAFGEHAFLRNLPAALAGSVDKTVARIIEEYGAIFIARGGAVPPDRVIFADEADVERFQSKLKTVKQIVGTIEIELQEPAMKALKTAIESAAAVGLTITTRGPDSAKRSYRQTEELWASRIEPALAHWVNEGRLSKDEADSLRLLSAFEQVPAVFDYEEQGIYFAKSLDKPIMYSVAPPGASQHLSMLALDVAEFNDERVRKILAGNKWYQTVISDLPHFTFLGVNESELSGLGLKQVVDTDGRVFWIPNI
ncbi:MAG TPA: hypothetical protein VL325_07400 [Pyrinomonadaceae bacterium]|nr:hypothetical protein [Pyrinomonadaceae bacterium]